MTDTRITAYPGEPHLDANIELVEQETTDHRPGARSRVLTPKSKKYIVKAIIEGQTPTEIARTLGVDDSTVARYADKYDLRRNRKVAAHIVSAALPQAAKNVAAAIRGQEPKGNVDISVRTLDRAGVLRIGSDEERGDDEKAPGITFNFALFDPRTAPDLLKALTLKPPKPDDAIDV